MLVRNVINNVIFGVVNLPNSFQALIKKILVTDDGKAIVTSSYNEEAPQQIVSNDDFRIISNDDEVIISNDTILKAGRNIRIR